MMPKVERFGVSMDDDLLGRFDAMVAARGYQSRSEAVRDMVRQELVKDEWADPGADVVGTISIVFEHHEAELPNVLAELQHQFHDIIICNTHVHMDEHNCLEVIIVRGSSARVKLIANTLISTKGVKHGQLVSTTTGARIS
jgi:CopG family transcriptional regulator, nickel-responsive regulator